MITRARAGIHKPNPKYALAASGPLSPVPRSVRSALKDVNWYTAMKAEYDALLANQTWTLVPRPPGARIITGKWVFKHKMNPDGTLERYKSRWVVRSFKQQPGIDFGETFLTSGQAGDHPHRSHARGVPQLAGSSTRCSMSPTPSYMAICRNESTISSPRASPIPRGQIMSAS
jgi:hypothetical protein